jgi:hypothetical protein
MTLTLLTTILAGVATLAIFTFLINENRFFRFFEHLFVGIAAGFGVVALIRETLYPTVIVPMFGLDILYFPDGTSSAEYSRLKLFYLVPLSLGLLFYFIYSKKYSWLAKLVIGFTLGISGGMAFEGFFNEMMPQITGSMKPLVVFNQSGDFMITESLNNIVFVVTLISVMCYFFFSFRSLSEGRISKVGELGRWLMMVCFGAFFGSTVMARMALLVERLQFLYGDFFKALKAGAGLIF